MDLNGGWRFIGPLVSALYPVLGHHHLLVLDMRLNLWPGKRSLIAKIEYEAYIHDVPTFNP